MADIAASVLTRLKNKAQASGRSYQLSLQLFCQEEFLRRLKKSKYAENFVLKGGLFIYSLTEFDSRVTVDVDFFLRQMPNTPEQLRVVLEEIIATPTENEFVTFEITDVAPIAVAKKYAGIGASLVAHIKNIDTENIADYIMRAFDGFVDLVEIKKPNGLQFWSATKDHNNYVPSTDLVKAITQCLNYIYAIEREANSVKFIEKTKSKVIKPRCILIFGRSNDWNDEQREAYRILNAAYNQISILTYDHLLFRAKNVLGITEDIDTTDDDELPF